MKVHVCRISVGRVLRRRWWYRDRFSPGGQQTRSVVHSPPVIRYLLRGLVMARPENVALVAGVGAVRLANNTKSPVFVATVIRMRKG